MELVKIFNKKGYKSKSGKYKINHLIILSILIFSLSIATQIVDAQLIFRKEKIGQYENGHKYYVSITNIDDVAEAVVNSHVIGPFTFGQNSGLVDITNYLTTDSDNIIAFYLSNNVGGWAYGFAIFEDSELIWADDCGTINVQGCMNNDQTLGPVYTNQLVLTAQSPLFTFARGSDNALWYRKFDGNTWSGWISLGGVLNSDPDSAKLNGNTYVFVRGTDDALWYRKYDGTSWGNWNTLGGIINSGPGAS